ncbi:calcium-activated chloride channel regulator 3A-1-like [Sardina pilchardus]|uniref:calcium-activated chloride channel regulator 3A-1-like n=1 Tax=Sardina pilchardus TaxID=27697 RepID=UPI002E12C425
MGLQTSGLFFVIFLSKTFGIQLDGHGYRGVLIAINPAVPEIPDGEELLLRIEDMIKNASYDLSKTAGNRFHFKEVTILVPSNWEANGNYRKATTQRYDKAHVIIDEPNPAYGDEPYTLQYGQCGDEGQYIHLTPKFLLDDGLVVVYGNRGKVFVHEWAHLRWGLYDEYSDEEPFYMSGKGDVEATRCSINMTGNTSKEICETDPKTGLPTADCKFIPDTSANESIMYYPSLDSVVDFCTTETHNAEAPNRQNQMCGNRAALDVILNSSVDAGVPEPSSPFPNVYPAVWKLESSGKTTLDWFNGTFSVDFTVGNGTVITIIYQALLPRISIRSPSGDLFSGSDFTHDSSTKTLSLKIPGTAELGEWHYSLLNEGSAQAMAVTVTSRAASADVAPIIVKAHMDQTSSDGSKAMVVYASVTQKGLPVILANVTATLESNTEKIPLQLEDKGTGADAFRHDGIYSAYFTEMKTGRYSLKVRVKNKDIARISTHRHNGAPYIPGYVVNGQVVMNPPKPPVNHEPVEVGSFSRTATGESFVVELPPGSTGPPPFPPCKITDLKANLEGDNVTLTWTAPGASYDQGTASHYHIHWSEDMALLRGNFNGTHLVNTSALSPQEAGSIEEHSFIPHNLNITNGTIIFIAVAAENVDSLRSEISNIVRVVNFIPVPPVPQRCAMRLYTA